MKKLLIMAVAACCLAACNKELGPEYKVAPVISNVSCSPGLDDVHACLLYTSDAADEL